MPPNSKRWTCEEYARWVNQVTVKSYVIDRANQIPEKCKEAARRDYKAHLEQDKMIKERHERLHY